MYLTHGGVWMAFRDRGSGRSTFELSSRIALSCFSLILFGCSQRIPPGHYEGNLLKSILPKVSNTTVGIDVSYGRKNGLIEVRDSYQNIILTLNVINLTTTGFDLWVPEIQNELFRLKKEGPCYF